MTIRILLVDDHTVVCKGLRTFLSYDHELEVVGEAADGNQALRLARELTPDVALLAAVSLGIFPIVFNNGFLSTFPHPGGSRPIA